MASSPQYFLIHIDDNNGVPLVGGLVTTQLSGTSTNYPVYTDAAGTVAATNPFPLDARGEAVVYLDDTKVYKFVITTSTGVPVRTIDPVSSTVSAADLLSNTAAKGSGQIYYDGQLNYVGKTIGTELNAKPSVFAFMTAAEIADVKARTLSIDVSSKINLALLLCGEVYAPEGAYRCDSPIAATNRASTGRHTGITGVGTGFDAAGYGTVFYGNTGTNNWMADFTGSQWVKLKNLKFYASGANKSTHGVRFARAAAPNQYSHNVMLENVFVICSSLTAATGGQGSVGVLNNQCEGMRTTDCWFTADTPYLNMMNNEAAMPGVADAGVYSNTLQTHINTCFQSTWKTAMSLYGAADMDFLRCIWTTDGVTSAATYAITLNNSAAAYQYCSDIRFSGQVERFPKVAYMGSLGSPAGGANYTDIEFDITKVSAGGAAADFITVWTGTAGANLFNCRASIDLQNAVTGTQNIWTADTGNTGTINLYGGETTVNQTSAGAPFAINNVLIKPLGHEFKAGAAGGSFTAGSITVAAGSSYRVSTFNSYLRGSVVWDPPAVNHTNMTNQAITVTGAAFGDSVKVYPPYTLSGLQATAYVDSANTVQIIVSNLTGATVNLPSGTWAVVVEKS